MEMMTEKEYRALNIDSYSSIKVFLDDRKKYYKKFILGEFVKEEESDSVIFGGLVDCIEFTPSEVEERYAISTSEIPSGQYGKLVNEMMNITLVSTDGEGRLLKDVDEIIEEAYRAVKFDRDGNIVDFKRDSIEVVKNKFFGSKVEAYYRQLRDAHGKIVVELSTLETANAVVTELNSNFVTKDIMQMRTSSKCTVYNQFAIIGEIDGTLLKTVGFPIKGLIDKLIIDHETKQIFIFDLKTVWDNENEFVGNYFKYKYYIQMAVYYYLVIEWKKKQKGLEAYAVNYPKFIVAESNNYKNPLIYNTDQDNLQQGLRGFIIKNKYYPGLIKAAQDIIWHKETGIWNISRDNYTASGIVKLRTFE